LSPGGTAAARKIDNGGPEAGGSSSPVADSERDQDSETGRREEELRAWALAWAEDSTPWSAQKWKRVNNQLGYRLNDGA
jgi:hypothetical protein